MRSEYWVLLEKSADSVYERNPCNDNNENPDSVLKCHPILYLCVSVLMGNSLCNAEGRLVVWDARAGRRKLMLSGG